MGLTLYHYVHCPFCIRVRMLLGFLKLPFQSVVLAYDDEATPVALTGVKMLPILQDQGKAMNESLEIMSYLDSENKLNIKQTIHTPLFKELESFLDTLAGPIHSLAMPYWITTPEFTQESRHYFQMKKEVKRGPFKDLVKNKEEFIGQLNPLFKILEKRVKPFYESEHFGLNDILIASHLWGLYIVPEFQFSQSLHFYLQQIKKTCHFNYHEDFWK